VEVAAMNLILKRYGYDAAEDYARKLQEEIKRKTRLRNAMSEQPADTFT
jgi:serine kinase of HPr protein (carbohydrate metabolism regulator)